MTNTCCSSRLGQAFLTTTMLISACQTTFAQRSTVVLDDAKVLATKVELSGDKAFRIPESAYGAVWVALDPVIMTVRANKRASRQTVPAGKAETATKEDCDFWAEPGARARLLVITPKAPHQPLTIGTFLSERSLEDASARNSTLVVAVTAVHFRDTHNLGDESTWKPETPEVIRLPSGTPHWVTPGIHHFERIGTQRSKAVSIEW